jgi:hypothetical protein
VIKDKNRAFELANELHDVVNRCVAAYAQIEEGEVKITGGKLERLSARRKPDAVELADFALACWRQAIVSAPHADSLDAEEGHWISQKLAAIVDEDLFLRWTMLLDAITGSDLAKSILMEGTSIN